MHLALRRSSLLLATLLLSIALPARAQLPVGAVAPDFTLVDQSGVSRSLSDSAGEVVVLFFVGYG